MSESSKPMNQGGDRRTFLKIGAGVIVGAAVAGVATDAYLSSVIGSNNSGSSSTVASLTSQLASTRDQLSSTAAQLSSAQAQAASLSGQLSSTQAQLTSASSALTSANSQLASTQQQLTSASGQITSLNGQVSTLSSQASGLQAQLDTVSGFIALSVDEQNCLTAVVDAIIPSDSSGVGAKEAGAIYFIDRQLATDYGHSANMYMDGPFVPPGVTTAVTVNDLQGRPVTYSQGTFAAPAGGGYSFQYPLNMREFWRVGLGALEAYSNGAYGGSFEKLSPANQASALDDLWSNKPTNFGEIVPSDFAWELFYMTWSGFLTDPLYGGNRNMVGWVYTAFNGVNTGNFYNEGHTAKELMVATTPTRLQPVSLAQFQKASP